MKKRHLLYCTLLSLTCLLCSKSAITQDLHFTQLSQNPLFTNPAYTGMFKGKWRLANSYRKQWSAFGHPYKTLSLSFDKAIDIAENKIGLSVWVVNDECGSSYFTSNYIYLSASLHKRIGFNHFHAGLQIGFSIRSYDFKQLSFPSQFNPETGLFDPNMPNPIGEHTELANYIDANVGIAWSRNFDFGKTLVGYSVNHINKPQLSFINKDSKLSMKHNLNSEVNIPLNNSWFINPGLNIFYNKKTKNILIKTLIGYNFNEVFYMDNIYGGISLRNQLNAVDAVNLIIGAKINSFNVGVSYDFNISHLRQSTNMKGAIEFTLVYIHDYKKTQKFTIPCDRY